MRKREKEIQDRSEIEAILDKAQVCRLALSDDNRPYMVPLNFGYKDNCLYFHTGRTGKKIDILKRNNSVCFQVDVDLEVVESDNPCDWNMNYRSVIGHGRAVFLEDPAEKKHALDIIVEHYGAAKNDYDEARLKRLTLIKVDIERMTGKRSMG
ncbi:MAG: pyridoxamine 5'-phosphate oxidase family protein [Thermodesulfobacteriota bacterium]